MIQLRAALVKTGLLDSFRRIATPDMSSSRLMKRLKADSRLSKMDIAWPKTLHYLRKQEGCSADPGGKRDMSTARPNIVVANGKVHVFSQK